jgi:hypothetical protein
MTYRLEFEIASLPKMANGGHGNWRADHGRKMHWRKWVGTALMGKLPKKPLAFARVTLTRCSSVEPDFDGLAHGFKPIVDALVHFGVIVDDRGSVLERRYLWEKAKPKQGGIRVVLEELTVRRFDAAEALEVWLGRENTPPDKGEGV